MSDSEEEDHVSYGTPLEPIDEDNIPKRKPVLVQDQIATDKHGKRRFHGAFTGGFSAGFFNTVDTLEGWSPAQFKSSRQSKAAAVAQRPEDFMDDEDTDDFGIAPTHLRAKPEYSGSTVSKINKHLSDGPIPGEPVLSSILKPAKVTIGVKLLMRLGWKPGQGIGPMLTWAEKMGGDIDPLELGVDPEVLFPPTPVQELCIKAKSDRFGIGYVGLSKEPVLQQRFSLFDNPLKGDVNKQKLAIRGQAFGVGAFEDEDEDIYATEDLSRYDFALETSASLREARRKNKEKEKLAICPSYDCIEGFHPAKSTARLKQFFPPPDLPPDFDPSPNQRKSRFGEELKGNADIIKGKHIINALDRAAILGETPQKKQEVSLSMGNNDQSLDDSTAVQPSSANIEDMAFRPFISDPSKQARYERFLGFIKIGAEGALKNIQPSDMSEWEKTREADEFEKAAKLYRPLSGVIGDKFSRGGLLDDSQESLPSKIKPDDVPSTDSWVIAAKEKKFGKLTRFTTDWNPDALLCKRMNIPEPRSSGSTMASVAEEANKKKKKCSVFDFLDTSNTNKIVILDNNEDDNNQVNTNSKLNDDVERAPNAETDAKKLDVIDSLTETKILETEDTKEKVDLFKAIFASDDEESDNESTNDKNNATVQESAENDTGTATNMKNINVLRNTSPPRGIFANLDLEALKPKPLPPSKEPKEKCESENSKETVNAEIDPDLLYGPLLPSKPVFVQKKSLEKDDESSLSSSSDGEWIEKGKEKSRKRKRSKKNKKEKKKDHHKHKKKKKR